MIKHCVDLNLTVFGTRNYDCIIKAIGVFSFPPQINNSVTIGSSYFLLRTLAIFSSNSVDALRPPSWIAIMNFL